MTKIAFIFDSGFIGWYDLILVLAAMGAALVFLGLYLRDSQTPVAGVLVIPLAAAASLAAARLVHWYCFPGNYASMKVALTNLSAGGFALVGVFAGCIFVAALTRQP